MKHFIIGLLIAGAGFGAVLGVVKYKEGDGSGAVLGSNTQVQPTVQQPSHNPPPQPQPSVVRKAQPAKNTAPNFTAQALDGQSITLAQYQGEKPVILDFWASWCHNCQRAMPELSKMYDKYKDQVEVIGVNLRESQSAMSSYVNRAGISFPVIPDASGAIARNYGIRYTNTHILINKDGSLARTIPGDLSERDILSLIQ